MNAILEIIFWAIAVTLTVKSVMHITKTLGKKDRTNAELLKAVVYVAGSTTIALLLIYKPFGPTVFKKIFKRSPKADAGIVAITTSLGAATSIGTTV